MTHVLVIGATGKQGRAVADLLLAHGHDVSALVRSPGSPAAVELADAGARLVPGDLDDADSLHAAARGCDAVFGLTVPFGPGGPDAEAAQGRLVVDVARQSGAHLVHSSVRGGGRTVGTDIGHVDAKQVVEAYLREQDVRATVLGPVYFMENVLNLGFSGLADGVLANPLSPGKPLDQVTVLDIAGVAVQAVEQPDRFVGQRVDVASDRVTGEEAARILSDVTGRDIPYRQLPLEQVRRWAGDEIADMFQQFEDATDFLDLDTLHATYPEVRWHGYRDWALTVDWDRVLDGRPRG